MSMKREENSLVVWSLSRLKPKQNSIINLPVLTWRNICYAFQILIFVTEQQNTKGVFFSSIPGHPVKDKWIPETGEIFFFSLSVLGFKRNCNVPVSKNLWNACWWVFVLLWNTGSIVQGIAQSHETGSGELLKIRASAPPLKPFLRSPRLPLASSKRNSSNQYVLSTV